MVHAKYNKALKLKIRGNISLLKMRDEIQLGDAAVHRQRGYEIRAFN